MDRGSGVNKFKLEEEDAMKENYETYNLNAAFNITNIWNATVNPPLTLNDENQIFVDGVMNDHGRQADVFADGVGAGPHAVGPDVDLELVPVELRGHRVEGFQSVEEFDIVAPEVRAGDHAHTAVLQVDIVEGDPRCDLGHRRQ